MLKVKCCGQTSRETGKLLRSSPEFFSGGFFVLRRKGGFLDFVLLFGEESLPLE